MSNARASTCVASIHSAYTTELFVRPVSCTIPRIVSTITVLLVLVAAGIMPSLSFCSVVTTAERIIRYPRLHTGRCKEQRCKLTIKEFFNTEDFVSRQRNSHIGATRNCHSCNHIARLLQHACL